MLNSPALGTAWKVAMGQQPSSDADKRQGEWDNHPRSFASRSPCNTASVCARAHASSTTPLEPAPDRPAFPHLFATERKKNTKGEAELCLHIGPGQPDSSQRYNF